MTIYNVALVSMRIVISTVIVFMLMSVSGILLLSVFATTSPVSAATTVQDRLGIVYLSADDQAQAETTFARVGPMREFHVANNGLTLLRGVRVISTSDDVIRVSMQWSFADFSWLVHVDANTRYTTSTGEKGGREMIESGDTLAVTGMLMSGGIEPVLQAQYIRVY